MIMFLINVIAFFLLAAALYLAFHAGEFRRNYTDDAPMPPVVLFSIVAALAGYILLVVT